VAHEVTLIPGDGTGPELTEATRRVLEATGVDLEWDVQAALRDWQQVRQLAAELGEKGWANRATGELGMIAFLKGNTGEATKAVQQALEIARTFGDVGG